MASRLEPVEAAAQATIVELAQWHRFLVYHTFDSRRSAGGYPDLSLLRERQIVAEVKKRGEKPRADQVVWLDAFAAAGVETYLWTLDDLDEIGRVFACKGGVDFVPASAWIPGSGRSYA